ncbi:MAG: F0F1 ATP synthase subunit epsilon [Deltaproteobacteria bacterium]|nr:F0F1 ATP synthase subunit epsilon [Deltaproteobacteria bacterium]
MNLKILLPSEVFLEEPVFKITAEAYNGSFTLLPRHIDFTAALVPGILSYEDEKKEENFLAVDEGLLVKSGDNVVVSTGNAAAGGSLGELEQIVDDKFKVMDEKEKQVRTATAKIEAGFIRRFLEISKNVL